VKISFAQKNSRKTAPLARNQLLKGWVTVAKVTLTSPRTIFFKQYRNPEWSEKMRHGLKGSLQKQFLKSVNSSTRTSSFCGALKFGMVFEKHSKSFQISVRHKNCSYALKNWPISKIASANFLSDHARSFLHYGTAEKLSFVVKSGSLSLP